MTDEEAVTNTSEMTIGQLVREIARLRAALAELADRANWSASTHDNPRWVAYETRFGDHPAEFASKALEEK